MYDLFFSFKLEFPQGIQNFSVRLETTIRSGRSGFRVSAGEKVFSPPNY